MTYHHALRRLNMSSLYDRREALTRRFGENLLKSPQHRDLLPPTVGELHGRNTRHGNRLQIPVCRHRRYKKSTIPYVVQLLNST